MCARGTEILPREDERRSLRLLEAFKAARLFYMYPQKVIEMQPTAYAVDSLKVLPFLDKQEVLNGLKEGLPQYLASALDVSCEIDPVHWWVDTPQTCLSGLL